METRKKRNNKRISKKPRSYAEKIRSLFKETNNIVQTMLPRAKTKAAFNEIKREVRRLFKNTEVVFMKVEGKEVLKMRMSVTYYMPTPYAKGIAIDFTLTIYKSGGGAYTTASSSHPESCNFNCFKEYADFKKASYRFERKLIDKNIYGFFKKKKKKKKQ